MGILRELAVCKRCPAPRSRSRCYRRSRCHATHRKNLFQARSPGCDGEYDRRARRRFEIVGDGNKGVRADAELESSLGLCSFACCGSHDVQAGARRHRERSCESRFHHAAGASAYAASKAAAVAMLDSLAAEVKGTGVRVNTILPSIIDTEANRDRKSVV